MSFESNYSQIKREYYAISKKILNYETRRELNDSERIKEYTESHSLQSIFKICTRKFTKAEG